MQLYGRLNLAVEALHHSGSGDGVQRASNNRSILGFRGSENLGGGWLALFQVEGTLFASSCLLPYSSPTSQLTPFSPTTAGYMSLMANSAGATESNTSNTYSFDRRQQNSGHYWTPPWQGWSLRAP